MKTTNKILCFMLTCLILSAFSGCRLAREEKLPGETPEALITEDPLVGVLVTTSYLDLFDREDGKLWGVLTEDHSVVFPDSDGVALYSLELESPDGPFTTSGADDRICDRSFGVFLKDDNGSKREDHVLDGTVYYLSGEQRVFYANPIYQTEDGAVYAVSGTGFGCSAEDSEEVTSETNLCEERTVEENGEAYTRRTDITLRYAMRSAPEKIVILQMGEAGVLLAKSEYQPGEMPERLTPEAGTQYLIVESHSRNGAGDGNVSREMISRKENHFTTLFFAEDSFGRQTYTELVWQEN